MIKEFHVEINRSSSPGLELELVCVPGKLYMNYSMDCHSAYAVVEEIML